MATRSDLRTRLQRRLGLGVVSALEQERLNEAVNSGLARAISDGVPGLAHDTFVGSVLGTLALTSAVTAANSSSVTIAGAVAVTAKVMPHDILIVDVAGTKTKFIIRDVIDATHVDIGIPATAALSGGSASTIERRALILPTTGQVSSIIPDSANRGKGLSRDPLVAKREPFDTGTAHYYEQRYSKKHEVSFASLWPAPTSTDQFTVVQSQHDSRLASDSDEVRFPEEALDAILERARMAYITWAGVIAPTAIALASDAVRDTSDSLKNTSNARQVFVKQ